MVIAIENECTDVVRLIFEYIGDINIQSKKDGTSILMIASEKGYTQTVELLLKRDAEVNMCNNDNLSSLMIASSNGRTEIVSLLLTYKAKVNMQGKDGCSALTLASRNDHFEVAKRLLEYGCDVNLREDSGATALMIACSNGYYKIVELLLQHDADVNLQDNIGMSALTFASEIGHNRMVKLLLFHQAKVNQRQDIGWFPLMYASNKGHVETVEILLEYGANVNMQSYCGWSALTVATNERHTETKEVLKAHGAITILSAGYDSKDTFTEIISVNNLEQIFSWHEFGLNIHIPDNSLPEDLQQCTIKIEASIGGDFELPPNTHLVSAVYSIKCDPKCQFSRQLVTLEIQHCAKPENTHKLFFVKALTSTEKTAVFREIKSEKSTQSGSNSTFPNHCSYGFVELNKFCKVAIAQRDTDERNYCAAIYYHKVDAKHYRIHFSIFWNDQLHSKVVHEQMCSWQKSIIKGHDQKVEFMENQIELDIPSQGGVTSQNGEWRILPLSPPVITREEVDSFEIGKRIPSCQLLVKCEKENPSDLEYTVALKGARSPYDAFKIYIISASIGKKRYCQDEPTDADLEPSKKYHTTEMTYIQLLKELSEAAADWEYIGMMLNLNQESLNIIKGDHPNQCKICFMEMIKLWFKQVDPRPSWSALVEPLDILGYQRLAKSLKDKFCACTGNT